MSAGKILSVVKAYSTGREGKTLVVCIPAGAREKLPEVRDGSRLMVMVQGKRIIYELQED